MSEPQSLEDLSPTERVFALAEQIERLAQQIQRTSQETRSEIDRPPYERRKASRERP